MADLEFWRNELLRVLSRHAVRNHVRELLRVTHKDPFVDEKAREVLFDWLDERNG